MAARKWKSHSRVVLVVLAVDLFWLLPLAVLAVRYPAKGPVLAAIAYAPVIGCAWLAGAGRSAASPVSRG